MQHFTIRLLVSVCLLSLGLSSCNSGGDVIIKDRRAVNPPKGPYLGQEYPHRFPEVFGPRIVNGSLYDRDITFSKDGREFYYTLTDNEHHLTTILYMRRAAKYWSKPEVADFSGIYDDLNPMFAPDGKLYFSSNRPLPNEEDNNYDFNIWYVERIDSEWSEPIPLDSSINTETNEYFPSITTAGKIYFGREAPNTMDDGDIYEAIPEGTTHRVTRLSDSINSDLHDYNAFVTATDDLIIFSSIGRADGLGSGDLYMSRRGKDGAWAKAENMGDDINSSVVDFSPFITRDGNYLFFTSTRTSIDWYDHSHKRDREELLQLFNNLYNGSGNIYWLDFKTFQEEKFGILINDTISFREDSLSH